MWGGQLCNGAAINQMHELCASKLCGLHFYFDFDICSGFLSFLPLSCPFLFFCLFCFVFHVSHSVPQVMAEV